MSCYMANILIVNTQTPAIPEALHVPHLNFRLPPSPQSIHILIFTVIVSTCFFILI